MLVLMFFYRCVFCPSSESLYFLHALSMWSYWESVSLFDKRSNSCDQCSYAASTYRSDSFFDVSVNAQTDGVRRVLYYNSSIEYLDIFLEIRNNSIF